MFFCVKTALRFAAIVISRPSRIHATPSAITIRVWNFDHGRRSSLAGIELLITPLSGLVAVAVMVPPPSSGALNVR